MKPKRDSMVEQFELVVKQEVINHNKSILANNVAMDKLRMDLLDLEKRHAAQLASMGARLALAESKIEHMDKHAAALEYRAEANHRAIESLSGQLANLSDMVDKRYDNQKLQICRLEMSQKEIDKASKVARDKMEDALSNHLWNVACLCDRSVKEAKKHIEALENKPSEALAVKDDLIQEFDRHKVDVNGIYEELGAFRREVNYEKKKVEELFNITDRLKKKV